MEDLKDGPSPMKTTKTGTGTVRKDKSDSQKLGSRAPASPGVLERESQQWRRHWYMVEKLGDNKGQFQSLEKRIPGSWLKSPHWVFHQAPSITYQKDTLGCITGISEQSKPFMKDQNKITFLKDNTESRK